MKMLDTNTCIFAMNNNPAVRARFLSEHQFGLFVSAITEAELWFGVENSRNREKNIGRLLSFLKTVDLLPFDTLASAEYGNIKADLQKKGTPIGNMDMLIAAHAKSANLTLVTNNTREFQRVQGLQIEDWVI